MTCFQLQGTHQAWQLCLDGRRKVEECDAVSARVSKRVQQVVWRVHHETGLRTGMGQCLCLRRQEKTLHPTHGRHPFWKAVSEYTFWPVQNNFQWVWFSLQGRDRFFALLQRPGGLHRRQPCPGAGGGRGVEPKNQRAWSYQCFSLHFSAWRRAGSTNHTKDLSRGNALSQCQEALFGMHQKSIDSVPVQNIFSGLCF